MSDHINRARLFEPYSELTEYQVELINILVEEDPNPEHVEGAVNILLDDIEDRFLHASEKDAWVSIANAAVEVASAIQHLPPIHRSMEARRRVKRWFEEHLGGSDQGSSSDEDGPENPQRFIQPQQKRKRGDDLER